MTHLQAVGGKLIVSVLDLKVIDETITIAGGRTIRIRGQVDPGSGLLIGGEPEHVPAGALIARGPEAPRVPLGTRIILRRVKRGADHPKRIEWQGMDCVILDAIATCKGCGARTRVDPVIATLARHSWGDDFLAEGARVIGRLLDVEPDSQVLEVVREHREHARWLNVYHVGYDVEGIRENDLVLVDMREANTWEADGEVWASVPLERRCRCGYIVQVGGVLAKREPC